jgi:shikimate dehydrogenase
MPRRGQTCRRTMSNCLVGVVGYPLGHSLSPVFQQAAFDYYGIAATYRAYPVPTEELAPFLQGVRGPEWLGLNVTIPHKEQAARLVDRCTPIAERIGAVNTLFKENGRLVGHNTDAEGFLRALQEDGGTDPAGAVVLVLGAGGAARAVLVALATAKVSRLLLANRHVERAGRLLESLAPVVAACQCVIIPWEPAALRQAAREADIVVNCTAVGMAGGPAPDQSPLPSGSLLGRQLVYDLVYRPRLTPLLKEAQAVGARRVEGLPMLIYQGAAAFELWTGRPAPLALMLSQASQALAELSSTL